MSGDLAEQLCLTRNLCSPSTWYSEGGPTSFGSKGASSTIDHWFIPVAATGNALDCKVSYFLGDGFNSSLIGAHVIVYRFCL
eukprot:9378386-Pyramimonas_sp.AAC.1